VVCWYLSRAYGAVGKSIHRRFAHFAALLSRPDQAILRFCAGRCSSMQDDDPEAEIERITQRIIERVMTSKVRLSPEHCARIKAKEQGTGSFIDRFMIAVGAW
jgi:hypothetical protein